MNKLLTKRSYEFVILVDIDGPNQVVLDLTLSPFYSRTFSEIFVFWSKIFSEVAKNYYFSYANYMLHMKLFRVNNGKSMK